MQVTFNCGHCNKPHRRELEFSGAESKLYKLIRHTQDDISRTCDCHDLSSVDDIVAVKAVRYEYARYTLQAELTNGGYITEKIAGYWLTGRVEEVKRPPSFKKVNAYLATADGLHWFKSVYLQKRREQRLKEAKENIEYAIRRLNVEQLEEIIEKNPLIKENMKSCRLPSPAIKYDVHLTESKSSKVSKRSVAPATSQKTE